MNRIIVAGSRGFSDKSMLFAELDHLLQRLSPIEIVCGEARGADTLGREWAESRGWQVKSFPANWNAHGRRAGYLRNQEMADYATHCVVFWDGQSRGSKHMIDIAKAAGLGLRVVEYASK